MDNKYLSNFVENEINCENLETLNNRLNKLSNLLLYVNIRSLKANFEKLQALIESLEVKPKIIICSESWTLEYYQYYSLQRYKIY